MITITGTLFDLLGCLAFVVIHITVLTTWKEHKKELWNIELKEKVKAQNHSLWLGLIGLEETQYYFNRHGLDTLGRWELWGHNIWK